jgi:hypothetical protein
LPLKIFSNLLILAYQLNSGRRYKGNSLYFEASFRPH